MTGDTLFYDEKAHFIFTGKDEKYESEFINEVYEVTGRVLDKETHSCLNFKYEFLTLKEANEYFDKMKITFPLSIMKIYKNNWQQCRYYG